MPAGPLRVALTGGIASGKSHCLAVIAEHGVPVIDADVIARTVVAPGTDGLDAVVRRFGPGVRRADGTLDRQALGRIVFQDPAARADLEALLHPAVYAAIEVWFAAQAASYAVADIPLLFESGRDADFDRVVVAACTPEQQLERLIARDGLTPEDARLRIAAQWPLADKVACADDVINTSGTREDTDRQVRNWLAQLDKSSS